MLAVEVVVAVDLAHSLTLVVVAQVAVEQVVQVVVLRQVLALQILVAVVVVVDLTAIHFQVETVVQALLLFLHLKRHRQPQDLP
jgi:hypothetical protein